MPQPTVFTQSPIEQLKNRQRAAAIGVLFQEAENQIFHSNVAQEVAFGLKLQRLSAEENSAACVIAG